MNLVIEKINEKNARDVNTCDGQFTIESRLVVHVEGDVVGFRVVATPHSVKRYPFDNRDLSAYIRDPDKTIFLAYLNSRIAGQVILRENWNRFALIEDIVVDASFRRQGVGRQLVSQARKWARERGLPGLMLETQDNNVTACRFYERCGFRLSGFDRDLYRGLDRETEEIALYWYLLFDDEAPGS